MLHILSILGKVGPEQAKILAQFIHQSGVDSSLLVSKILEVGLEYDTIEPAVNNIEWFHVGL